MALTLVTSDLIHGLDYSKLTGTITTWNQDTTGNAATATLAAGATILATARNIGGVSFNGSAAINLPGVNTAGNQNTSGNAGTVTNGVYTVGDQTIAGVKTFSSGITQSSGTLQIKNASGDTSGLKLYQAGSDVSTISNHYAGDIAFNTANTSQKMIIKNSGKVGIGTTSPAYLLTASAANLPYIASVTANVQTVIASDETNSRAYIGTRTNHPIAFVVDGNEKIRILSSGNVGIGKTPDLKILDLQSTSGLALRFYNSTAFKAGIEVATTNGDMIGTSVVNDLAIRSQSNILFSTGGNTERLRISSGGNVGVGTSTFASTANLQLKIGNMGSGIVGEIFDAVDNADNSRLIICGGGTGTPQFSIRHYSAAYGMDMWLNTSSPWDTYIDNRHGSSGFIFRNNCNNNGAENELIRISAVGSITAPTLTTSGTNVFTGSTPLTFHKTGSDTYTKTVVYDAQNNTTDNAFSGITIEMAKLTNSNSAAMRNFTISSRGATEKYSFSRHGLSFNQTTASASNSLDAYEEGSWTPVVNFGGTASSMTPTYNNGKYTRVGDLVTLTAYIVIGTINGTGAATLTGLPFQNGSGYGNLTSATLPHLGSINLGSYYTLGVNAAIASSTLAFIVTSATTTAGATHSNFSNGATIMFNFTYKAS